MLESRNFDFMGKRRIAAAVSMALVLVSIALLIFRGLNLGLDFTGGTLIEVGYEQPANLDEIRNALEQKGFEGASVQYFGTSKEVLIRLAPREGENRATLGDEVLQVLRAASADKNKVEMRRVEFVGPQIGEELREDGGLAMLYALFGILVYVAFRFEYRFSVASVVALIHDVTITLGFFALTQMEFDLTVLAAILAVIGYSLNDTIVVFDRIRENFRAVRKKTAEEVVNISINQTLSRTIITSLTTLLVLISLFLFGGEIIHSFSVALIVGVVVGTYSSIFIASTSALAMGVSQKDLIPEERDKDVLDDMP